MGSTGTSGSRETDRRSEVKMIAFGISPYASNGMKSSNPHSGIYVAETSRTLDLNGGNPACNQGGMMICNVNGGECMNAIVRRLTPKECERLQGFPDGWTDIGEWTDSNGKVRQTVDSARYKALGNAIALPFWEWLAKRIRAEYPAESEVTMASLFDGIGGFPLVFSRADVLPVWASEIEEFPIAVTKRHFPEEGEANEGNAC